LWQAPGRGKTMKKIYISQTREEIIKNIFGRTSKVGKGIPIVLGKFAQEINIGRRMDAEGRFSSCRFPLI
jgi:hypothetical protein